MPSTQPVVRPVAFPKPLAYGTLALQSRYLLSPLAGYTNLPFRLVVRELGGLGLATTDLVNSRGLLAGNRKSLQLIESCPADSPMAVQIFGNDVTMMCDAAQLLEQRHGVESVDINMGCPVDRITKGGSGAGMMRECDKTIGLVAGVASSVAIPVTVKMRLGWDESNISAPMFAAEFEKAGVAAIAIHGRTRAQGFGGQVDLAGIRQVVEAVESIPVIGNGDVRCVADAARMLEFTGCDGVSVGRGALANPWIFRQLDEWERTGEIPPSGNFEQRLQLLMRQFAILEELRGTKSAIIIFRKTAHWYLKAMRVRAWLRHQFQLAKTRSEFEEAIKVIAAEGPIGGSGTDALPDMHIPVPSGPIAHW